MKYLGNLSILSRFNFNTATHNFLYSYVPFQSYQGSILTIVSELNGRNRNLSILSRFNFNGTQGQQYNSTFQLSILSRFNFNPTTQVTYNGNTYFQSYQGSILTGCAEMGKELFPCFQSYQGSILTRSPKTIKFGLKECSNF